MCTLGAHSMDTFRSADQSVGQLGRALGAPKMERRKRVKGASGPVVVGADVGAATLGARED